MSGVAPQRNPYAPPKAPVADLPDVSGAIELASRSSRLGAVILDTILLLAINLPLMFALGWWDASTAIGAVVRNSLLALAVFLVLNGYLLAKHGQTIGKKLVGLRIVRPDGSRASSGRVFGLRYGIGWILSSIPVAGAIYGLVDSLLIFRQSRKCLHDNIADTIVIKV